MAVQEWGLDPHPMSLVQDCTRKGKHRFELAAVAVTQLILFPAIRAREIQAQEGVSPSIWGPPTSGNSTPLRENIPESPSQDGFPDLIPPPEPSLNSPSRRTRAGTVPSRFSPVGTPNGVGVQQPFPSMLDSISRHQGRGGASRLVVRGVVEGRRNTVRVAGLVFFGS